MRVTVADIEYEVIITKKKTNKNTYLRVKEDLKLYITTGLYVRDTVVKEIVERNYASIVAMYQKQLFKNREKQKFYYLGLEYDIIMTNSNTIDLGTDHVFIGKEVDLDGWYKKCAKTLFQEHLETAYNQFNRSIPPPSLKIRKMKSRWGVCNTKEHAITLNLELMKQDVSCLDYVIVHELSHLVEANHSIRFWKVVEENFPNYKNVRKRMKQM